MYFNGTCPGLFSDWISYQGVFLVGLRQTTNANVAAFLVSS